MELVGLMLCGMSVVETARLFSLGKSTVSARRLHAYKRLGFSREADLHRFVADRGLSLDRSRAAREMHCF
jgi:two-component system capsular synthesis response regulator RcsB